jgi:hypothetical protein
MELKLKVGCYIRVKSTGAYGKIVMFFGEPYRELYAEMFPGADSGYEYITMYDQDEGRVGLRALNRYHFNDVKRVTKKDFDKALKLRAWLKRTRV